MTTWRRVDLVEAKSCGDRYTSFRFERAEDGGFVPGQYVMLRVPTDEGPAAKPFTLSSAPADAFLEITTRVSGSTFKRSLAALRPGDAAEVSEARGDVVLPAGTRRAVFLTGGIGITPARSILRDAEQRGTDLRATVLFGNADDTCVPFADELRHMGEEGLCELVLVYERPPADWPGERGMIDAALVARHVDVSGDMPFVVSGPPAMADAMDRVLGELDVPPERRLVQRFAGY